MNDLQDKCYPRTMKAQEKELIFNLLKCANDNFYGYHSKEFQYTPEFSDDPELEQKTETTPEPETEHQTTSVNENKPITLDILNNKINSCSRCPLHLKRKNAVPGEGVEHPDVLIIGEGPGEEEDNQGLPFVGPAGELLNKMLHAIQLDRKINCYIANTVKCRPPYNRDPEKEEAEACRSYLDAQIHILKPKIILALGKVAVRNLLKLDENFSLNKYRGQIFEYKGIPLIITYHPSALLRNIEFKKPAWEDLKFFKSELLKISPDYAKDFRVE